MSMAPHLHLRHQPEYLTPHGLTLTSPTLQLLLSERMVAQMARRKMRNVKVPDDSHERVHGVPRGPGEVALDCLENDVPTVSGEVVVMYVPMRDPSSTRKAKLKLLNASWNPNRMNNLRTISFRELTKIRSE
eukprot:8689368-Pyramimonas_sp.AAC.1